MCIIFTICQNTKSALLQFKYSITFKTPAWYSKLRVHQCLQYILKKDYPGFDPCCGVLSFGTSRIYPTSAWCTLGYISNLPTSARCTPDYMSNLPKSARCTPGYMSNLPISSKCTPGYMSNLPISAKCTPGNMSNLPTSARCTPGWCG